MCECVSIARNKAESRCNGAQCNLSIVIMVMREFIPLHIFAFTKKGVKNIFYAYVKKPPPPGFTEKKCVLGQGSEGGGRATGKGGHGDNFVVVYFTIQSILRPVRY